MIIVIGTPLASWMARWAGNAARSSTSQARVGARSSAASRIELGGQSVETGGGWRGRGKARSDGGVGGKRGEEQYEPGPRRRQEQRGQQDRIGRPERRNGGRVDGEREA